MNPSLRMTGVLIRRREERKRHRDTRGRSPCEDRDWRVISTSQGTLRIAGHHQKLEGFSPIRFRSVALPTP